MKSFFEFLMNGLAKQCEIKRICGRPIVIKVDDSYMTEVKFDGQIYRIFVQKG